MSATTIDLDRTYTPDELLELPEGESFELVDGRLEVPDVSALSSWVEGEMLDRIADYVRAGRLGWTFPSSQQYRCFPHRPRMIRKPDVSFLAAGRFGLEDLATARIVTHAPDLAVEVVSPNDLAEDLELKVCDYLLAGARLVWLVYPRARRAAVRRSDGTTVALGEDGLLEGEDVLPGLSIRLGDVLPPPLPEAPAEAGEAPLT